MGGEVTSGLPKGVLRLREPTGGVQLCQWSLSRSILSVAGSRSHTLIHDSPKNNKNSKSSKSQDTMVYKEKQGINPQGLGRMKGPARLLRAAGPFTSDPGGGGRC